jgi:hypothetical protein
MMECVGCGCWRKVLSYLEAVWLMFFDRLFGICFGVGLFL